MSLRGARHVRHDRQEHPPSTKRLIFRTIRTRLESTSAKKIIVFRNVTTQQIHWSKLYNCLILSLHLQNKLQLCCNLHTAIPHTFKCSYCRSHDWWNLSQRPKPPALGVNQMYWLRGGGLKIWTSKKLFWRLVPGPEIRTVSHHMLNCAIMATIRITSVFGACSFLNYVFWWK